MLNTKKKYGILMKFIHWSVALLFIAQFCLIYRRWALPEDAPQKIQYILLHKSFGVLLLGLALVYLIVRHLGQRPAWPAQMPKHERWLARLTHIGLAITMFAMPISGLLMSGLGGNLVKFFGYPLPTLLPVNKALSGQFYNAHVWISYTIIGLFALHVIGALVHHFIRKDDVLRRMLPFARPSDE